MFLNIIKKYGILVGQLLEKYNTPIGNYTLYHNKTLSDMKMHCLSSPNYGGYGC